MTVVAAGRGARKRGEGESAGEGRRCRGEIGVCEEEGKGGDEERVGEGFFDSLGERRCVRILWSFVWWGLWGY